MFELIYDRHNSLGFRNYQDYMQSRCKDIYFFQDRIFLDIPENQMAQHTSVADLFLIGCNPRLTPANWLKEIIILTHRHPSAHHQLKQAIAHNLSVEEFVSNVAKSFCSDWKQALDLLAKIDLPMPKIERIDGQLPKT